ncbi:EamA family transporter [Nonomuraea cypriaca]|uniref:EamA family transporter n=1 Tax=Nonomuraea cypriaca TaxID=1187855 RepID=UPI0022A83DA8|nr:EamA family transporter [Nonomuraea cypriaca]
MPPDAHPSSAASPARSPRRSSSAGASTVVQLVVGGLVLSLAGIAVGEAVPGAVATPDGGGSGVASWAAFGYLVVVDSLAGFALFAWLLRAAPVSLVSTYSYAVPVVACLVAMIALGEPLQPAVLAGAALILAAVAAEVRVTTGG